MRKNEIRILKHGPVEILGFHIKNETGEHLFIEVEWDGHNEHYSSNRINKLVIRKME